MASTPSITSPSDNSTQSLPFDLVGTGTVASIVEVRDDAGYLLPATANPVTVDGAGDWTIHVTGLTGSKTGCKWYCAAGGEVTLGGYSDAFTGTAGTALATHDANWGDAGTTQGNGAFAVSIIDLDGSGNIGSAAASDWENWGARYTASSSDTSRIVIGSVTDTLMGFKGPTVRSNGTNVGYYFYFSGSTGSNYTTVAIYRSSTTEDSWIADTTTGGPWAHNTTHELALVATQPGGPGTTVNLYGYVDGTLRLTTSDSTVMFGTGNPGLFQISYGSQANGLIASWQDT